MRKYQIYALLQFDSESSGNAAAGVEFNVYNAGGGLATIYAQNGASPISQSSPLVTDSNGRYEFYAANGRYSILFTDETIASQNVLTDVSIYEYGSAGALNVATNAQALAGTAGVIPDAAGVHAAFNQYGLGLSNTVGSGSNIIDSIKTGYSFAASPSDSPKGAGVGAWHIHTMGANGGLLVAKLVSDQVTNDLYFQGRSDFDFVKIHHTDNLAAAQNTSGGAIAAGATTAGSNLTPAKTGTWRNVSNTSVANNSYAMWSRV